MLKIKKGIAAIAACLLMSSGINVRANNLDSIVKLEDFDCHDQVYNTIIQADNSGEFTEEEIQWIANAALAIYCYGYTLEEVIAAQ